MSTTMCQRLVYDFGPDVEAFSTLRGGENGVDVLLPQHQAHSTRVVAVTSAASAPTGVDALITNTPGLRIGVKTADCVPILLHDPRKHAIAAIHSGWRGTLANIIAATLQAMTDNYASTPADIKAVIGPCIHLPAFEVGDDVYRAFADAGYADFCHILPDIDTGLRHQWHIDLPGICDHQLRQSGVIDIEIRQECTYTLHHLFYSARRLKDQLGHHRILNCIMLK